MRVLVLDSDRWREMGIARVLDRTPGITPILERDLGDMTLSKSLATVVLVAETSTRTEASRSLQALRHKFPEARILVHGELDDPAGIAELMAQGADGYFTMSQGEETLVKALRVVARGAHWIPEGAVSTLVEQFRSGRTRTQEPLTEAELNLLSMLDEGLTNKEMASRLGVAEITVKTRLSRLFRRFRVRTRLQLLSYVVRHALLPRSRS